MLLFSPFEPSVSIQKWMSYNYHNIGYVIDDHHPSTKVTTTYCANMSIGYD
jgi:hypothetical protein